MFICCDVKMHWTGSKFWYLCFVLQRLFPYTLIQYDTGRDEPIRDANGLCVEAPRGESTSLQVYGYIPPHSSCKQHLLTSIKPGLWIVNQVVQ